MKFLFSLCPKYLDVRITLHTNMLINSLYSILGKVKIKHKEKYHRLL